MIPQPHHPLLPHPFVPLLAPSLLRVSIFIHPTVWLQVTCIIVEDKFVPFQRNYRFQCRICAGGEERFELLTNTWTSIVLTAMYNLFLSDDGNSLGDGSRWTKLTDISAWIESHWGSLTSGRDLQQVTLRLGWVRWVWRASAPRLGQVLVCTVMLPSGPPYVPPLHRTAPREQCGDQVPLVRSECQLLHAVRGQE